MRHRIPVPIISRERGAVIDIDNRGPHPSQQGRLTANPNLGETGHLINRLLYDQQAPTQLILLLRQRLGPLWGSPRPAPRTSKHHGECGTEFCRRTHFVACYTCYMYRLKEKDREVGGDQGGPCTNYRCGDVSVVDVWEESCGWKAFEIVTSSILWDASKMARRPCAREKGRHNFLRAACVAALLHCCTTAALRVREKAVEAVECVVLRHGVPQT